jgi:glycosyltransferase involved in cell wall biosynthesis
LNYNKLKSLFQEVNLDKFKINSHFKCNNSIIIGNGSIEMIHFLYNRYTSHNKNKNISIIANEYIFNEITALDLKFDEIFLYKFKGLFSWAACPRWWKNIFTKEYDKIFCFSEYSNLNCISNIIEILLNLNLKNDLYIINSNSLYLVKHKNFFNFLNIIKEIGNIIEESNPIGHKKIIGRKINKVLFDCRTLNQNYFTGIPRYSHELLNCFALQNYKISFSAVGCSQITLPQSVDTIPIPLSSSDLVNASKLLNLIINFEKPELVYSPYYPLPYDRKCIGVLTIHDLIPLRYPEWFSNPRTLNFFKNDLCKSAQSADRIIAVSKSTKKDIQEFYGIDENKISVIYSAPSQLFQTQSLIQKRSKIPSKFSQKPYFLSVATVEPRKNLIGVIKAFEVFRDTEKSIDANLIVVGKFGWKNKALFEAYKISKYRESIIFTGFIEDQVLIKLYQNTLAFIYVSLYEGFGFPVLEAMCCGAPVITSNNSSLREIALGSSITCNPYNFFEIANAMLKIVTDGPFRKNIIKKGYNNVKKFSWDKTASETVDVFNSCLS